MNPQAQSMLPPQAVAAAVRRGGDPNQMFQQNPMAAGLTPDAMASQPQMQTPPTNGQPIQPPQDPNAMQQSTGQVEPLSEAQMILNALEDRLKHHSKVEQGTIATLTKLIEAGLPVDPSQQQSSNGQ